MELPSKLLEQIAFNTRPKREEHMLVVMDKSTHEEHLSQPLQTNHKQFKRAVIFLTGYNGIFKVSDKNNKFYFAKSTSDEYFFQIPLPSGAYEIERLNNELTRNIIDGGIFTEANYPITIKLFFSTLGSHNEISPQGPLIVFPSDNGIRDILRIKPKVIHEDYKLSDYPVDILSFDIILECHLAQVMIFKGRRSGIILNFTMDVDPGDKYIEKFRVGVQWFMMESKVIFSSKCFKLKNENHQLVSFNGQSITFR